MVKLQYLLRAPATEALVAFRARALDLGSRVLAHGARRLKVTLTGDEPPRVSVVPYRRDRLALLSLWDEADPAEAVARWSDCLPALGASAGYRVAESTPKGYERAWPDGTATPGVCMLTLLHRRRGLSGETFLRRWHDGHSHLALEVHPLWSYVRNVVEARVLDGSPPLCGIVEEQFRTRRELLDPVVFFGGWVRMLPNMARVLYDVRGFLDLGALENYLCTEHWLRS